MGLSQLAYKVRHADEKSIATILISGFTGQLKNWWDNALTLESKTAILNHTIEVEDEQGNITTKSDAAEFLIVTIAMYFVGNPKEELHSNKMFLTNLRCPTLTDYRWYKDMFLTHVLRRPDCNMSFWKEKFITGLPTLFSQRIMTNLQKEMGTDILSLEGVTMGQLLGFIKKEGLALCTELKMQQKYGSQKQEVGSFCEAFGIQGIRSPSALKRKSYKKSDYIKKGRRQPSRISNEPYYKKFKKRFQNNRNITCWKCGRLGHKANNCKVKQKINEIFSDNSELKEKILAIMINEEEVEYISNGSEDYNDDKEISSDECNCKDKKYINVITTKEDKEFLLDLIEKIDNIETRKTYLEKLKGIILAEEKIPKITEPFSISRLLDKYPIEGIIKKDTTHSLQKEINELKQQVKVLQKEILELYTKDLSLETKITILQSQLASSSKIPIEPIQNPILEIEDRTENKEKII